MFKFHAVDLTKLVRETEVTTSSTLAERVVKRGTTPAHARQLLKRLYEEAGLWRSSRLALPHDERLFARKTFFGSYGFLGAVASILRGTTRHGMARCLTALSAEDVLHEVRAQKLLAAPLSDKGSSPSITAEWDAMDELGVTVMKAVAGYQYLVSTKRAVGGGTDELAHIAAAHIRVEQLLARVLTDVHRKQNMLTWNRVDVATADRAYAEFNDQVFSATGYSYLDPVVRWEKGTPIGCPVVYDVYPGRCEVDDVRSMIQRMERATHRGEKKQRCLGIIAGRSFSNEAWELARHHRLMTINFRQTFGEEALEALNEADRLIALVASDREQLDASEEAGKLAAMIRDLKTNDVVVAVKSIAFEVLAALTMRDDGWEDVGLGRDVPFVDPKTKDKTTRDVDVYGKKKGDLWLVECKAYGGGKEVTDAEVRKFFHETVPSYISWHRERRDPLETCYAELWTTGVFSDDAKKFFAEMKVQKAITAELRDAASIRGLFAPHSKGRCEDLLKAISSPVEKNEL